MQTDKSNETVGTSTDLIEIIDNNVNNLSEPSTHFYRESISLPDFNGDSNDVSIENWLAMFEEIMKFRSWNEHESIFMLGNYLKGEALEWYMTVRRGSYDQSFSELKSLFMKRFALRLIEFKNFRYDSSKDMLDYYKNKRRLGTLAVLSEAHIVSFMIDGLPVYLSSAFNALKPQSMDHFFEIASRAEINNKLRGNINQRSAEQKLVFSSKFSTD